jgi:hypothetical protein
VFSLPTGRLSLPARDLHLGRAPASPRTSTSIHPALREDKQKRVYNSFELRKTRNTRKGRLSAKPFSRFRVFRSSSSVGVGSGDMFEFL